MTLPIKWSEQANHDVQEILLLVAEFAGWQSAERYLEQFENIVELAATQPYMGKMGSVAGTRELYPINGKYRIVYRLLHEQTDLATLEVITVILAKRQYP